MSTTPYLGLKNDYVAGDSYPHAEAIAVANDLEAITAGYVEKDVSGSADVTLSAAEYVCPELVLQGVLTGNISVILPAHPRRWLIHNDTSGAFAITVKTLTGSGVVIPQGYRAWVYGDGTDILPALTCLPADTLLADVNLVLGTATGSKIGTSTLQKLGFWNATPIVRPGGYTQTYATADKTLSAYTPNSQSSAYTGAADGEAKLADLNALRTAYQNLKAFCEDLAQLVNAMIDDDQALGLRG